MTEHSGLTRLPQAAADLGRWHPEQERQRERQEDRSAGVPAPREQGVGQHADGPGAAPAEIAPDPDHDGPAGLQQPQDLPQVGAVADDPQGPSQGTGGLFAAWAGGGALLIDRRQEGQSAEVLDVDRGGA